jgi:hypothetical protein
MRVWITARNSRGGKGDALLHFTKPDFDDERWARSDWDRRVVCRRKLRELFRPNGIRLPRHGSKQIVCVELEARKVG